MIDCLDRFGQSVSIFVALELLIFIDRDVFWTLSYSDVTQEQHLIKDKYAYDDLDIKLISCYEYL